MSSKVERLRNRIKELERLDAELKNEKRCSDEIKAALIRVAMLYEAELRRRGVRQELNEAMRPDILNRVMSE